MGLCIYYSGSFRNPALLPEMIEELKDISEEFKWNYHVYETEFPPDGFGKAEYNQKTYGISLSPPECEPLWFSFLSNGRMSNFLHLEMWGESESGEERNFLYSLVTKTQYAGIEVHKVIIHLFRHISEKYFTDFEMFDEGGYWESNDVKILEENFRKYNYLIDSFAFALENSPKNVGENLEDYLKRMFMKIHKNIKDKKL